MKSTYRRAVAEDIPALLALYVHLTGGQDRCTELQAATNLLKLGAIPGSGVFVAEQGRLAVSTVTLVVIPNLTRGGRSYALIENVVTAPQWRGRGIATTLLKYVVSEAWSHDCYKVMLLTGSDDPKTLTFYEHAGFEQSKTGFQIRRIAKR